MRILILIQRPQARGSELFASHLGEELIKRGHEVRLITLFEGDFDLPFSGKIFHLKRNPALRFFDYFSWRAITEIVKDFNPDVVQAMGADTLKFMVFSKLSFRWNSKTIFFNGSMVSNYIQSYLIRIFNQWLYSKIDGIVSVSKVSKLDFKNLFSFRLLHKVIPVGILIPDIISLKKPSSDPVLVHIGGFTFEKNHTELLEVFSQVLIECPNAKLLLIGDGPLKAQINKLIDLKQLAHTVSFLGAHKEPFSHVSENAILILPSKIEGMPAVIGEAFIHRIPVIAYNVGAVSELIISKKTGWLIDANETGKMVKAILELMKMDPMEISEVLDTAELFARGNLDIVQVSGLYEDFYNKLLAEEKPYFEIN